MYGDRKSREISESCHHPQKESLGAFDTEVLYPYSQTSEAGRGFPYSVPFLLGKA